MAPPVPGNRRAKSAGSVITVRETEASVSRCLFNDWSTIRSHDSRADSVGTAPDAAPDGALTMTKNLSGAEGAWATPRSSAQT